MSSLTEENACIYACGYIMNGWGGILRGVPRDKVVCSFGPQHKPVEDVEPGELVLLETEDALGEQVKNEETSLDELDRSRVDGATGPIFIEGATPGDTLTVEIRKTKAEKKGVRPVMSKDLMSLDSMLI